MILRFISIAGIYINGTAPYTLYVIKNIGNIAALYFSITIPTMLIIIATTK